MNARDVVYSRAVRTVAGITVMAVVAASASTICLAQGNPLVAQKANIGRILRGQSLADGQAARQFEDYFKTFFRQFINEPPDPKYFPDLRHDLRIFRLVGQKGEAYDRLTEMSYRYMAGIALSDKYNVGARINALLILGELNEQEGGKPLPKAFKPLLVFAASDTFRGQPIPDELKVAAMVGLKRWAALGAVPPDQLAALSDPMLKLLTEESFPASGTLDGHNWMRRGAAEILAALGNPGQNGEVVAAYEKIIANSGARNTLRCQIAECLGKLTYPQGSNTDLAALANLIGHQTVEICQREVDTERSEARRRLIAYVLRSSLLGLEGSNGRGGLKAASSGTNGQQFVEAVRAPIDAAYETSVDEDLNNAAVLTAVETMITELESVLREKPVPKADNVAAEEGVSPAEEPNARAAARPPSPAEN